MALGIYSGYPFVPGNLVDLVDTYTGTGTATTFTLVNKTSYDTGATIVFDFNSYYRWANGFYFPNINQFTLSTAPPNGSQGVAPGLTVLEFAGFDQTSVPGVSGAANVIQQPFWLADNGSAIVFTEFQPYPGQPGIALQFQNLVSAQVASTTWTQLACANPNGTIGTLQATGTTLYTDGFYAFSTLSASASANSSLTLVLNAVSGFYAGDYVILNVGASSQENPKVTAIDYSTNTLTITGLNYNHYGGETVFMNARQFWSQVIIPVNALDGVASTLYNLGLKFTAVQESRL